MDDITRIRQSADPPLQLIERVRRGMTEFRVTYRLCVFGGLVFGEMQCRLQQFTCKFPKAISLLSRSCRGLILKATQSKRHERIFVKQLRSCLKPIGSW